METQEFQILHFYPDLMSLYGSYANLLVLKRYLEQMGNRVVIKTVLPGEEASLFGIDFVYMGAGTERAQKAALTDFRNYQKNIRTLADEGAPMLFAGTAMELLGESIIDSDGTVWQGISLASFQSMQGRTRFVEDVYGHTDLYPDAVLGFMNKCAVISEVQTPLLTRLDMGFGNEQVRGPEGFHWNRVFASELTGPLLVKNPRLLDEIAEAIYAHRGLKFPEKHPQDIWAENAYQVTEEQLRLRLST